MPNFKFKPNSQGFEELMTSEQMQKVLETEARKVMNRLPSGYGMTVGETVNTRIGRRAKVTIGTRSAKAVADNLQNNTLTKALGGGT